MAQRRLNWNAAALSLLVPGWGQFEQGRLRAGRTFLTWGGLAGVVALLALSGSLPGAVAGLEVVLVTLWSGVDALIADLRT